MTSPSIDSRPVAIRPAGAADVEAIQSLTKQSEFPCSLEEVEERLGSIAGDDRNSVLVAEMDGRVVGFAHLYVRHNIVAEVTAELSEMIVDKEYGMSEVPWAMIEAVERWARSKGCFYVCARTDVFARESHTLLEKSGYNFFHTQMGFRKRVQG